MDHPVVLKFTGSMIVQILSARGLEILVGSIGPLLGAVILVASCVGYSSFTRVSGQAHTFPVTSNDHFVGIILGKLLVTVSNATGVQLGSTAPIIQVLF